MGKLSANVVQFLGILALAACAAPPQPLATATWHFEDTAAGALPKGFVVDATRRVGPLATWEVREIDGAPSPRAVLGLTYPNHRSYDSFNLCWNPGVRFRDGVLSVRLCARSGQEDQGGGLVFRAQGPDDYYVARLNPLEGNLRLYCVRGGSREMLASADCEALAGTWYELRVEQRGDRIRCAIDGKVLLEASDGTLAREGGIGLWTKADAATDFDDLRAEPGD